ncbi:FMN-binding protein [Clostridium lacusfryxellense]|uniref:FMN-binding protein n=1 Tax=Clostridium lacusfryxellense TaxID=205328 RepID=UPI001C0E8C9B|nr:FMN-binding protein [Clostridium lacusfryxellense]MBU3114202.1 FMN-binding protein [Clostridium lacusfryxellense]
MKKLLGLILVIVLAGGLVACGTKARTAIYKQGTYEGNAEGHIGPIKVQIVTDDYEIIEIKIIEQQEIPIIADSVYEKIPERVIKTNNADVEVVAGATYTSNGLIKAIKNGLDKAKIIK